MFAEEREKCVPEFLKCQSPCGHLSKV
jgi:hypothetical protein